MIRLTRINHNGVVINSDLIEHIDATPDTVITLTTGQKLMVLESPDDIIDRVVAFRRRTMPDLPGRTAEGDDSGTPEGTCGNVPV